MVMKRLHIHQHEINPLLKANLLRFKGIPERTNHMKAYVGGEHRCKMLLHIEIVFYNNGIYHISCSFLGRLRISAKAGLCEIYISPPAASTLRRRLERPPPSTILCFGGSPLFVIVTV